MQSPQTNDERRIRWIAPHAPRKKTKFLRRRTASEMRRVITVLAETPTFIQFENRYRGSVVKTKMG